MNKVLWVGLVAIVLLSSCTKTKDSTPTAPNVEIAGQSYATVTIGARIWMAVNYNGSGGTVPTIANYTTSQGKLYTLAQAQAVVLPTGWRLPTKEDFEALAVSTTKTFYKSTTSTTYLEGEGQAAITLMSKTKWKNGTNTTSFNAEPTSYNTTDKYYLATFLCASPSYSYFELADWPIIDDSGFYLEIVSTKPAGWDTEKFSIRFVKDKG